MQIEMKQLKSEVINMEFEPVGIYEKAEDLENLIDDILAVTDPVHGIFPVAEGTWKMWRDRKAFAGWSEDTIDMYLNPDKYQYSIHDEM